MTSPVNEISNFVTSYNHVFGLFELTSEPILVADRAGKICYCNSIFVKLFGYEASSIVGKSVEVLMPERYRSNHPRLVAEFWKKPFRRSMYSGVRPIGVKQNGEEVFLDISLSPVGEELVLCMIRDITEEIKTKNIEQQSTQLSTMGLLTASLLHEIANPVQAISYSVEFLKKYLTDIQANPYLTAKIEDIEFSTSTLLELLGAFRELRGPTNAKSSGKQTGSVKGAIQIAKRLCSHKLVGIEFIVQHEFEEIDQVPISTGKLAQVLINLYANASDALQIVSADNRSITTKVSRSRDDDTVITVTDSGPGVATNLSEKIFDPLFSTKPQKIGTGLGLNICRDILKTVNGALELVSQQNTGASFRIVLPKTVNELATL